MKCVNNQEYEVGSVIGGGATSTVHEVYKKEKYARKELKQFDHKSLQRFLQESGILLRLRHPCIVRIIGIDYGDSSHPPSIYLSFEASSLDKSIQDHSLTKKDKNRITVEIVLGMRYIHSNNLMHRDLKPANILLSKNHHVRISDFGLTKEEDAETSQTIGIGTLRFMAPELVQEQVGKQKERYTNKIDVYSFGITLIYIVTEEYPTNTIQIWNGVLPALPTVVPWVVDLIHKCLQVSPNNRPTFNGIFEIMQAHNFDLFNETSASKLTIQQQQSKKDIEHRIRKIEAFEYQHRL